VLGTLAIYHREPRAPAISDIAIVEQSARLASIAIERSMAAEKIRHSEALYRLLTEDVVDVVWKLDRDFRFTYISPSDERLRGYTAEEVIGHHVFEMFNDEGVATVSEMIRQRQESDTKGIQSGSISFTVQHRCKDGSLKWGEVLSKPERDAQGAITGYHGITREVTGRMAMEDQVRQLAFYDPLTGLPNRRLLNDRLNQTMAASKRSGCYGALMFLDLDNFKPLNDLHGHAVGDLLLVEVAERMKGCIREMDTVARFGGDEFVIVLGDLTSDKAESIALAGKVAEKMRIAVSAPYRLIIRREADAETTVEHHCTASIGVAMFLDHEANQDDVLKWADRAMYQAKSDGRNLCRFYSDSTALHSA
jgi:diguanylate cyclase (GGDEF)-like protein/PAS domain S-box-containing protein